MSGNTLEPTNTTAPQPGEGQDALWPEQEDRGEALSRLWADPSNRDLIFTALSTLKGDRERMDNTGGEGLRWDPVYTAVGKLIEKSNELFPRDIRAQEAAPPTQTPPQV